VKLLVDEPGTDEAQRAYSDADGVRSTAIAHLEATAALARMRKGGRLTPAQLRRGLDDLENLWQGVFVHDMNERLLTRAVKSARDHSLRAYDAAHLAGALFFAAGEEIEFACWDKELRDAAKEHGFPLVPPVL
jgi:predicted nucleic acid-binding protein